MDKRGTIMDDALQLGDALQPGNFDSDFWGGRDISQERVARQTNDRNLIGMQRHSDAYGYSEPMSNDDIERMFKAEDDMAKAFVLDDEMQALQDTQKQPRPMTPPPQERLQASEAPRRIGEPPSSRKRKGAFVDQLQKTKGGDDYTLVRERDAQMFISGMYTGMPVWGPKTGIDPNDPEYENTKRRDFGIRQFLRKEHNVRPEDFGDPAQQSRLDERGLESLRATQTTPMIFATSQKANDVDPYTGLNRYQKIQAIKNRYDGAWD